ncbi:hypothetical protein GC175_04950 [bacterium]|nr:hypothetical protein [bacterium]
MTEETTTIEQGYTLTKPTPPGSKLTAERVSALCGLLADGVPVETACGAVNMNRRTFYQWLERGEAEPETVYGEFAQLVRTAQDAAEVWHVQNVKQAAQESRNWTASAWWLERRFPERWGKRERITVGGDGQPLEIQFSFVPKKLTGGDDGENGNS